MRKKTIQGLLIDLDGVLYKRREVIPGAVETLRWLRQRDIPFRFVTNTTRMYVHSIARHLESFGFEAAPEEIVSPPVAAGGYMRRQGYTSYHLLASPELHDAFSDFTATDDNPDAVIVGDIGDMLSFDILDRAFRRLMDGADLVALHKDRFWTTETGVRLDTGAFVAALEYASDKTATVVGKPETPFFTFALESLGLSAEHTAMVGDSVMTDIHGAQKSGIRGILARTGNYQYLSEQDVDVKPELIIDSIADLPDALKAYGW
jgi:HAD superfamily hydrolase (TIGR01458 family)